VAQLTTKGALSFELNLEVINSDGSIKRYVANDNILLADELVSPYLKYPLACGCMDPNFLEYKKSYSCSVSDSCKSRIVFGCTDTMACNYNPNANYNIVYLCCYPGWCNDRDLELVCPQVNGERLAGGNKLKLHPNPASDAISFEVSKAAKGQVSFIIYNSFGIAVKEKNLGMASGQVTADISHLEMGLYFLRLFSDGEVQSQSFFKN
jgi:hypothetical protein